MCPEDTAVIFLDLGIVRDRLARIKNAFPDGSQHAVAIKTNPLMSILTFLAAEGLSLEAASFVEVKMALRALDGEGLRVVYDSPAKTQQEIDMLASQGQGMHINLNKLSELLLYENYQDIFSLGLRINPVIDSDAFGYLSVSNIDSKFGEYIGNKSSIIDAFYRYPALIGLHVHIGSSFLNFDASLRAIRSVLDLAQEINDKLGQKKVSIIDIGGGFPVNYKDEDDTFEITAYAQALEYECKELWSGQYKVITEFGRYVHANAGWAVSRIHSVFSNGKNNTMVLHLGADMFLRACYNPGDWFHHMHIMTKDGILRNDESVLWNIGGPLCFGGDYIDMERQLPKCQPEDLIIISDVGANTFSLWSKHCSRQFPKVIAYDSDALHDELRVIKERESVERAIEFWS